MPRNIDGSGIYHHICEETIQGANLEFGDFSKEKFEWNTEDNLDGMMEPYHRIHLKLAFDLPIVILGAISQYLLTPWMLKGFFYYNELAK